MVTATKSGLSKDAALRAKVASSNAQGGDHNSQSRRAKALAVGFKPSAAALGVEIILVPEPVLRRRIERFHGGGDILQVIAVAGNKAAHALRPQRGNDAGSAAAPIVAGKHGALDSERSHQLPQIVAERRLLTRSRRLRRQKPRRTEAAQIRHDDAAAGGDEGRNDFVVAARIIGPPVQQNRRRAVWYAALLVGDVERRGADVFDRGRHLVGFGRQLR